MRVAVVAPASCVPQVELQLGVRVLEDLGFLVDLHPQCQKRHAFFAGTDRERALAFFEAAFSEHEVLWSARGGYGCFRILPLLQKWTRRFGIPPKKLLVGYSDVTVLMEYVRSQWNWSVLHAPMPSMRTFRLLPQAELEILKGWIQKKPILKKQSLTFWTPPPTKGVMAPLVGGNLTVWNSLVGTSFLGEARGCFLFFEDVDEALYRMDRMLKQLEFSGALKGVRGILLGNFKNCKDAAPWVLKKTTGSSRVLKSPKTEELKPLRPLMETEAGLRLMFSELGKNLRIPVAFGLPVGHGPEMVSLPLGAKYRLTPEGSFEFVSWDWLRSS
jgi:muramoyltetrapeptide carboxypeptidase